MRKLFCLLLVVFNACVDSSSEDNSGTLKIKNFEAVSFNCSLKKLDNWGNYTSYKTVGIPYGETISVSIDDCAESFKLTCSNSQNAGTISSSVGCDSYAIVERNGYYNVGRY